jgi:toxin ParE1/3/4
MESLQAMASMSNYRLSPLAEEDLFKIISTTIASWGSTQAEVYAQTIDSALFKLAQYPDFGKERSDVYNGARSFPVEKN